MSGRDRGLARLAKLGFLTAAAYAPLVHAQTAPTPIIEATPTDTASPQPLRETEPRSVTERQEQRDREIGVSALGLLLMPQATADLALNSNVFAEASGQSDAVLTVAARMRAESEWARHLLRLDLSADRTQYFKFTSENATQARALADGRIDLASGFTLSPTLQAAWLVEPRTSIGAPILSGSPVRYHNLGGSLDGQWSGARATVAVGGGVSRYRYDDTVVAGVTVSQADRDFTQSTLHVRGAYELGAGRQVYVNVERDWLDYRLGAAGGSSRNSNGWQVTGGLSSEITPLLHGRIGLGYISQHYANSAAKPVSALGFDVALDWYATELTTVHAVALRRFEGGSSGDLYGYLSTRVSIKADHEWSRSLIFSAGAAVEFASFRSIDRSDRQLALEVGARYQLDRNIFIKGRASLLKRSSSGTARVFDYTQAVGGAQLGYQF